LSEKVENSGEWILRASPDTKRTCRQLTLSQEHVPVTASVSRQPDLSIVASHALFVEPTFQPIDAHKPGALIGVVLQTF
jgi:hypothetical protein